MSNISLRDLASLPAPRPDTIVLWYTGAARNLGAEQVIWFQDLAKEIPYQAHGLGWYLRWLFHVGHEQREAVIDQRNRLKNPLLIDNFRKSLSDKTLLAYLATMELPDLTRRIDCHRILIYDHQLRTGDIPGAQATLDRIPARLCCEFMGLPFVRRVICQPTEDSLWKLTQSHSVLWSPR
jgi:hypothetical protein